jgi:pimeloyl-ACP methyl ester carboxylesterase
LAPGFVPAWLFLIALFVAAERSESSRLTFTYVIPAVIFCLLWLGPQILLYAMRGVFGSHYAMPAIIGAAAVNGLALDWLSKSRARILYVLAVLWAAACIGLGGIIVSGHVSQYRARTLVLNEMIHYIRKTVPNGAPLIVVADPARSYEATVALIVYLGYAGRADIPIYLLSAVPDRPYSSDDKCLAENLAQTYFSNRHDLAAISPDRVGAVVLFAPVSRVPSCWQNWLRDARLEPVVFSVSWYALVAKQRGFIRGEATLTVLVPRPRHT